MGGVFCKKVFVYDECFVFVVVMFFCMVWEYYGVRCLCVWDIFLLVCYFCFFVVWGLLFVGEIYSYLFWCVAFLL